MIGNSSFTCKYHESVVEFSATSKQILDSEHKDLRMA